MEWLLNGTTRPLIGIDLHANNCVVAVVGDRDKVRRETAANELPTIVDTLSPFRTKLAGCWLVDGLTDAEFQVRLAHTGVIPQYADLKYTNDETDA